MKEQDILKDGISFTRTFTDENGSWFMEFKSDEVKQLLQLMGKQNLERIQINKKKKMKRKIIYAIALALICYAYYYAIKNYRSVENKQSAYKEFGIIEKPDIFVNNMEDGRYTSHGRLMDDK